MTTAGQPTPEVRHVKDPGVGSQWAKGLFYRREGRKLTAVPKAFIWSAVGLFLVGVIASFFTGDEPPAAATNEIGVADINAPQERVTLSPTSPDEYTKAAPRAVGTARSAAPPVKLAGLQLVRRPGAGEIPPGSMLKARLISGASNGPLRAEVVEPLVVNGETRVERGGILVGMGQSTEKRLFIRFSQLVFKDGTAQEIQAQACDGEDQTVGLKGSNVSGYATKLAAAAALNFAGGVSEGMQESEVKNGVEVKKTTTKNALLNGATYAALDQAKETMSSVKSETPIIEVPVGTVFWVLAGGG